MIKACVIGSPVKHSRSPLIHSYWLRELGIHGQYERREILPADLGRFLLSLPAQGLSGCNITLPHKETACSHVQHLDDRVKLTGSLNTVYLRDGETYGTSTDGEGFAENITWRAPGFGFGGKTVLILGAGGTSRAIIDELLRRNVRQIFLANRTSGKAEAIARVFGSAVIPLAFSDVASALRDTELLINATSAGIASDSKLSVPFENLRKNAVVTDINYVPLMTPFLQDALSSGHVIVTGLGMLLHQAVRGFSLWFGQRPRVSEELFTLVARDIDPEYRP